MHPYQLGNQLRGAHVDEAVEITARLCERFEGFYSRPYICPAGVPTIGFGFTRYPDGRAVTLADAPMDKAHAKLLLRWLIKQRYLPETLKLCPNLLLSGHMAAICDFAFNLGTGNLKASTLRQRILAERWGDVGSELRKWVRGGGRVLPGLLKRRNAEAAYFE